MHFPFKAQSTLLYSVLRVCCKRSMLPVRGPTSHGSSSHSPFFLEYDLCALLLALCCERCSLSIFICWPLYGCTLSRCRPLPTLLPRVVSHAPIRVLRLSYVALPIVGALSVGRVRGGRPCEGGLKAFSKLAFARITTVLL